MALNTPLLKTAILSILDDQAKRTDNPAQAREDFAQQLAEAITAHIKTGQVQTTGTAAAQTGTIL
ncbi:hypothetical protein [Hymenobacter metallicola]|uniref:Uncharacterized protein n=1 Tax=Hymenobacter metallicola TaxID=2563114 RepID=A0A4Z0Q237_9BACT|nr:hypothetical protein [Hymenobacter metallicola]TGE23559.1 hypothetical protein E5K02_20450 [Hymenobacter metallicola]